MKCLEVDIYNDSVRCRCVFKPQRVSKYIERLPTKFSYLFLYWC